MTSINPNSRQSFIDREGRLTKYGMGVIGDLVRAIGSATGTTRLDEIDQIATEATGFAAVRSAVIDLETAVHAIQSQTAIAVLSARLTAIEQKLADLEAAQPRAPDLRAILQRLDDLEAMQ